MATDSEKPGAGMVLRSVLVAIAVLIGIASYSINSFAGIVVAAGLIAVACSNGAQVRLARWLPLDRVDRTLVGSSRMIGQAIQRNPIVVGLIVGCASAGYAAWLVYRNVDNPFAPPFWLLAMAAVVAGAVVQDRVWLASTQHWPAGAWRWAVANRLEVTCLVVILVAGLLLRGYDLKHYPPMMHGDEGEMGWLALQVLQGSQPISPFETLWLDFPGLFYYGQAFSMLVFGRTELGLRMFSVLFGTASILAIYVLGRIGWGAITGLAAAWLMAISHLHIHWSRLALNNIHTSFALILTLTLLAIVSARGRRRGGKGEHSNAVGSTDGRQAAINVLLVLAGLVMSIAQYLYYGSRLIPLLVLIMLVYLWLSGRIRLSQAVLVVVVAIIAFAPLGAHFMTKPVAFTGRTATVNVFRDENVRHELGAAASLPKDLPALVSLQLRRSFGFFFRDGDASAFYLRDIPAFDPLTVVLGWLGLGIALTRVRRLDELIVVGWFLLGVLLAGFFTMDSPNGPRLIIVVPSLFLLGGIFVKYLVGLLPKRPHVATGATVIAIAAAGWALSVNVNSYFVEYASKAPSMEPILLAREMLAEPPQQYHTYLIGEPAIYVNYGTIRFVAREAKPRDLEPSAMPDAPNDGKGLLVIAITRHADRLKAIEQRYPGGFETRGADNAGRPVYVAYRVPPRGG